MAEKTTNMEQEKVTQNDIVVEAKEGFGTKIVKGFKKHGKKSAVVAVTIAAGTAGYVLGKKLNCNDDEDYEMFNDSCEMLSESNDTTE